MEIKICPMINHKLKVLLHKKLKDRGKFTASELLNIIGSYMPENTESTHRWWINVLKKENYIYQTGRGIYSFTKNPDYRPALTLKVKRLYNSIQKRIPCCENLAVYETPLLADLIDIKAQKH